MNQTVLRFSVLGLQVQVAANAVLAHILLALLLIPLGSVMGFPTERAILFGVLAAVIHMLNQFFHHFGHSLAARQTGHPMSGMRYRFVLATSLYPRDEGELPAEVHIRRALGGPIFSFVMTIVYGVLLLIRPEGLSGALLLFALLTNLLIFSLGAFLPLGFTDGSTLLRWWGKRGQS